MGRFGRQTIVDDETRMAAPRTAQLSLRIREDQKVKFVDASERCGMDPSSVARQMIELALHRVEAGGADLFDCLYELRQVWGVPGRPVR